jgi:hypothetical protein
VFYSILCLPSTISIEQTGQGIEAENSSNERERTIFNLRTAQIGSNDDAKVCTLSPFEALRLSFQSLEVSCSSLFWGHISCFWIVLPSESSRLNLYWIVIGGVCWRTDGSRK